MGRDHRRRRDRSRRGRELGVGRGGRDRARPHPGVGQPLSRRLRRRDRARIRYAYKGIRGRRLRAARGQDTDQLGRQEHRSARHKLRGGLTHRIGISEAGQALAPGAAAARRRDAVHRGEHGRHRGGIGGPHTGIRANVAATGDRLLQRRGVRTSRLGVGPHRRADRRHGVVASQLASDRAAHGLAHRHRRICRRFAAGRRLRGVRGGHSRLGGGVRTRRAHLPAPLRLDSGQADHGDAGRRRQPRGGGHTGLVAGRAGAPACLRTPTP